MPSGWKKNVTSKSNNSGKGNAYPRRAKASRELPKDIDKFFGRVDEAKIYVDPTVEEKIAAKKAARHAKFVASGQEVCVKTTETRAI